MRNYSAVQRRRQWPSFSLLLLSGPGSPPSVHLIPETEPEKKGRVQHFLDCTEAEILDNYGDQIPTRNLVGINYCEEQALRNLIPPCNDKFCSLRGEERRQIYCIVSWGPLNFTLALCTYIHSCGVWEEGARQVPGPASLHNLCQYSKPDITGLDKAIPTSFQELVYN